MLAADAFTVGTFGDAEPLSLILPRTPYEYHALVGRIDKRPAAIFLSGPFAYHYFESAGNDGWKGVIIPRVRVEVDETSLFEVSFRSPMGSIIRSGTKLAVRGKQEQRFDEGSVVVLHDDLISTGDHQAGFKRWQVVIGEGLTKQILWRSFDDAPEPSFTARPFDSRT